MAKINIISNISSKRQAGVPFCMLDHERKCKIENDKVVFSIEGEHTLQIGYQYGGKTEDKWLMHYDETVFPKEDEEWYLYKVPILLNGKGGMKKISKTRFEIESKIRKLVNNRFFLIIILIVIYVISYL